MNAEIATVRVQTYTSSLLRTVLRADGSLSLVGGIAAFFGAGLIAPEFGVPAPALAVSADIHAVYGAVLLYLSTRKFIDPRFVWAAIALDALWVVGAVALL